MELHQVRYFLAVCRNLNFSRAAEECNVTQPSLSRAIKLLEEELGGDLFRRERALTHITDLGRAVLPILRQCYESAAAARSTARAFLKEGHAPLRLAMSRSLEMELISPVLAEVTKGFPGIELKIFRGPPREIGEKLKSGDAEIAIAGPLGNDWERLDAKALFEESFGLVFSRSHVLAKQNRIEPHVLVNERLLCRTECVIAERLMAALKVIGVQDVGTHELPLVDDLIGLARANLGIGVLPMGSRVDADLVTSEIEGIDMKRWIHVYTVAGRQHTPAAGALKALLRVRQWTLPVSPLPRRGVMEVMQ